MKGDMGVASQQTPPNHVPARPTLPHSVWRSAALTEDEDRLRFTLHPFFLQVWHSMDLKVTSVVAYK